MATRRLDSHTLVDDGKWHGLRRLSPSGMSGIALGTIAGAATGGPVGAVVGAIVGGAAGEALERVSPSKGTERASEA